ncbi:hypothetical protein AMTRI_Chr01g113780 [Amborella trichopoda]|nr:protein APEM9 isoform X1 [Amborella trichopoda]|eukprot:XP_011625772.1 protein APEM9 isoform X1 [Amborella trichopoda]
MDANSLSHATEEIVESDIDFSIPCVVNWEQIELSESFLVSCMFEEAASLSSSIIKQLCNVNCSESTENLEIDDMKESAAMVFIQSYKELGRTQEMLHELKVLFGSVTAIPIQALVTGACLQISEGCASSLRVTLEEFLGKWKYSEGLSCYVLANLETENSCSQKYIRQCSLRTEEYLKVAEFYAVVLHGRILKNAKHAMSWLENADILEEERQGMLRKLHAAASLSEASSSAQQIERKGGLAISGKGFAESGGDGYSGVVEAKPPRHTGNDCGSISGGNHKSLVLLKKPVYALHMWFRKINAKFGYMHLLAAHGKIAIWGSLVFFIYYIFHRKHDIIKRTIVKQALALRKALVDAWQLAFSVHVNPLAAVQPLPAAARGSR